MHMADSVDRVFSHALNTVNKIRTGSVRPPANVRLKLYGLYKQSMEGDIVGIMERPEGKDEQSKRAKDKWDAWHDQLGLSRTDAKRYYITTLIETMQKYASASPESRELVAELEFVWDQVKSNVPSSEASSPIQSLGVHHDLAPRGHSVSHPDLVADINSRSPHEGEEGGSHGLQLVDPLRRTSLDTEAIADCEDDQEFVDARDSQVGGETLQPGNTQPVLHSSKRDSAEDTGPWSPIQENRKRKRRSHAAPAPPSSDEKWKTSISTSIIQLTAELAALREQLEARRLFTHRIHFRIFRYLTQMLWRIMKHVAIDMVILGAVLLWLRQKKDRRLEGAVRVLLGDAVAHVQKLGDTQLGKLHLPKMASATRKSKPK